MDIKQLSEQLIGLSKMPLSVVARILERELPDERLSEQMREEKKQLLEKALAETRKMASSADTPRDRATAIVDIGIYDLMHDQQALERALESWLKTESGRSIEKPTKNLRALNNQATEFLHRCSEWRALKQQAPDSIKDFVKRRTALAERVKQHIPKEATAWSWDMYCNGGDLSFVLEEAKHQFNLPDMFGKMYRTPEVFSMLREKVEASDMDKWGQDDLIAALIEHPTIRHIVAAIAIMALENAYVMAAIQYWAYFDQNIQIPNDTEGSDDDRRVDMRHKWAAVHAGKVACESKAWGEFTDVVKALSSLDFEELKHVVWSMNGANQAIWEVGHEVIELRREGVLKVKEVAEARRAAEREAVQAKTRISGLERQVEQMRAARAGQQQQVSDTSAVDVLQLRKQAEQLQQQLDAVSGRLQRTDELLRSVLSATDGSETTSGIKRAVTLDEVRQKRGIVIGGHQNLIWKLRRELENCTYYSPNVKSLDEDAVRNSEFILFFAGYVNHCLSGHALRLSRLHGIPVGYTDKTNVSLVMEDLMAIFSAG